MPCTGTPARRATTEWASSWASRARVEQQRRSDGYEPVRDIRISRNGGGEPLSQGQRDQDEHHQQAPVHSHRDPGHATQPHVLAHHAMMCSVRDR